MKLVDAALIFSCWIGPSDKGSLLFFVSVSDAQINIWGLWLNFFFIVKDFPGDLRKYLIE